MLQNIPVNPGLTHEADGIFRMPAPLSSNLRFQTQHSFNIRKQLLIASPHFPGSPSLQWNAAMPARGTMCCQSSLSSHHVLPVQSRRRGPFWDYHLSASCPPPSS